MTQFDSFKPEALVFLKDLKANNNKEWFTSHKAVYEAQIKGPGQDFAADMCAALQELTGRPHSSKIFRIYRDVRFSKDKTPYNAHLHIAFKPEETAAQPPMWFFGLSPEKLSLGCGVFQYERQALAEFRKAMAGPKGAKLIQLTDRMRNEGFRVGEPELQRVPAGFEKDHPNNDALRRKGFSVWNDTQTPGFATEPKLVARTIAVFSQLMPVFRLLT